MDVRDLQTWYLWAQGEQPSPFGPLLTMLPMLVVLFYFVLIRPARQEQQKRDGMLREMKKDDRVVTVAGIYGTVVSIRREADEVTLRVDETNNTRLRVTIGSISRVIHEESATNSASKPG